MKKLISKALIFTIMIILIFFACDEPADEYEIGDTGPAGGLIFYKKAIYSDGWQYLEAAIDDQASNVLLGCAGTIISGADGTVVGTGEQNTIDIVADCNSVGIAAKICSDLVLGGYSDWFLPSRDELHFMYTNLSLNSLGGFNATPYWSSTEIDLNFASLEYLNDGTQQPGNKNYSYYLVRAVRAF